MAKNTREIRGIPLWLLREYLEEIGGTADGEFRVIGEDWVVTLTQMEPFQIGSLRVGQVFFEMEAEPDVLTRVQSLLEKKTMRAGA
jgi:hypothetical protein